MLRLFLRSDPSVRYFVGMTTAQAAEVLGITEAAAKHYWIHPRTWLFQEITTHGT